MGRTDARSGSAAARGEKWGPAPAGSGNGIIISRGPVISYDISRSPWAPRPAGAAVRLTGERAWTLVVAGVGGV